MTLLTFILALVIEPLLVMAVLPSRQAARRPPQPARDPQIAELRLLAIGPKNSFQDRILAEKPWAARERTCWSSSIC